MSGFKVGGMPIVMLHSHCSNNTLSQPRRDKQASREQVIIDHYLTITPEVLVIPMPDLPILSRWCPWFPSVIYDHDYRHITNMEDCQRRANAETPQVEFKKLRPSDTAEPL
jgi:hypothetical protein